MSVTQRRETWTWEAYLEWEARQELRYELVDGEVYAMGGGTGHHDIIANNVRGELRQHLRGTPCRVQGPDLKVRAGENGRYPDAIVDCGSPAGTRVVASEPAAVFEVLSRSTAWIDQTLKVRDYNRLASIRAYVLISQDEPKIMVYRRDEGGHLSTEALQLLEGLEAVLELPEFGVRLPLRAIYEDVDLENVAL